MGACTKEDPAVVLTMDADLNQAVFTTPEIAAQAFTNAVTDRNRDKIGKILGLNAEQLLPLDNIKPEKIKKYLKAYSETHTLKAESDEQKILSVGKEDWTLPIPIIKGTTGWYFDSVSGKNRIRIRRIGRNELAVMQVVLAYHDAQIDFASIDRNANGEREYAQKFISSENVHDGLYWETADGEELSPLGSLFVNDTPEGAYHGYYYRIITSQGDAAKGGAENYVVDGLMTGGFALIAWPAVYGRTGVMSFIVNHDGIVYQQNLGQDTADAAMAVQSFDPSSDWSPAQEVHAP
ncbi:MAG: DUF2950 domain-containing protein [Pseudomonadota bacterium]|nr:DUF2950 domain-containing protein [Pseudomonadota bacterium]